MTNRIETTSYIRDGWFFGASDGDGAVLGTCRGDLGLGLMITRLHESMTFSLTDEQAFGLRDALNQYFEEHDPARAADREARAYFASLENTMTEQPADGTEGGTTDG